ESRRHFLAGDPRIKLCLRDGENPEAHVRVRRAAVLGTESVPDATRDRAVGRVPEVVRAVRHDVALATELRSPERVNNVGRAKSEIHGAPDRNVDLVRRGDSVLGISEFPPPLVAGDVDVE